MGTGEFRPTSLRVATHPWPGTSAQECPSQPTTPYRYRKVGARSTLRELIIPFGTTGSIQRFDIRSPEWVLVICARHQREEDFH